MRPKLPPMQASLLSNSPLSASIFVIKESIFLGAGIWVGAKTALSRVALVSAMALGISAMAPGSVAIGSPYPGASPLAAEDRCPEAVVRHGDWLAIVGPEGGRRRDGVPPSPLVYHFAVDPRNPSRMLVSHLDEIHLSTDGGCTWEKVFEKDFYFSVWASPQANYGFGIRGLKFSESDPKRAYAAFADEASYPSVGVLRSDDGGRSWGQTNVAGYRPMELVVSPSDANRVYLSVKGPRPTHARHVGHMEPFFGNNANRLFASDDGGETWTEVYSGRPAEDVVGLGDELGIWKGLTVDPGNPNHLWVVGVRSVREGNESSEQRLFRSQDGGRTWSMVPLIEEVPRAEDVDVARGRSGGARVAVVATGGAGGSQLSLLWSEDDGASWVAIDAPRANSGHRARSTVLTSGRGANELGYLAYENGEFRALRFHRPSRQFVDLQMPYSSSADQFTSDRARRTGFYLNIDSRAVARFAPKRR